jgi:predicted metal-binding membrane protein
MTPAGRRASWITVGVLVGLAAVAWALTVRQALDMRPMAIGLGQVGTRMPSELAAPLFMGMWLAMLVAMMFPAISPMVLAHRMVVVQRGEGPLPTVGFVLGYLTVWTAIGLVPMAAFIELRALPAAALGSAWLPVTSGLILVGAGVYQFTPAKGACLKVCRGPLQFILSHDFGAGILGAFRAGVDHGSYCLGCCWALMSVLVVVGLMNLVWMAVLAVVFLAEKNWRHGPFLGKLAGTLIAVLGAVVIVHSALLIALAYG